MKTHFLNGKFVSEEELLISPRDLGFTRGYALFEFLKTYPHHRLFKPSEHIERLFHSAKLMGLVLPWTREQVLLWVTETLAQNVSDEEKYIKIMISGGVSKSMIPEEEPTLIILIDPAVEYPAEYYEKGIGVITVKHTRYIPEAKSNNYIEGVKQTQNAKKVGALEPIYYSDEQVFEGSNSNVFAVIDGKVMTPESNILQGVARGVVIELLRKNMLISVKNFTIEELQGATEIFLTGSGKEIMPVTSIDGKPVGNGEVGPVTKEAMRQYKEYTLSHV